MGMKVVQKFRKFRVLWHGRTQPPEFPGAGMDVIQNLLTEVPGTGNIRVNAHPLGGEVRFEVKDSIQLACGRHVLTGPMSPRQSVV